MAKNSKHNKTKKETFIYEKEPKEPKKTIMVLKKSSIVVDGKVNNKTIIGEKHWFGKDYWVLDNIGGK